MERHLAAFKAGAHTATGTGLLSLVAATAGLAQAGTLTGTEALPPVFCSGIRF
jgi:hypothetical protein